MRIGNISVLTPLGEEKYFGGTLTIEARDKELMVINTLAEESYLFSVVAHELPKDWPREAVRAQCVTSRTYMENNLGRHKKEGFDFCDLAHCQVFKGNPSNFLALEKVLRETPPFVLSFEGKNAEVFFHSTCGGHTSNNEDVWPAHQPIPYLRGQPDGQGSPHCRHSPFFSWTVRKTKAEMVQVLPSEKRKETVEDIRILKKDTSGRVKRIFIQCGPQKIEMSGDEFYLAWGRTLGWHELKSTLFEVNQDERGFVFKGRGLGHGVGLCQWGARNLAEKGYGFREILSFYFPKTVLMKSCRP